MPQIIRVDILDGQTLDIELSNGHLILFDTQRLPRRDHSYDTLRATELLTRPETDGQSVYWAGGPRIELSKIMELVTGQAGRDGEEPK